MIETTLTAIRDQIRRGAPNLKTCEVYDGELSENLLETLHSRGTPSAHVAFVGTSSIKTDNSGQPIADLGIMVFVLTRHFRNTGPREAATDLCEMISDMALNWTWGVRGGIMPATDVRIDNLYSGNAYDEGVAFYSVGWQQRIKWGRNRAQEMHNFPELTTTGDEDYTYEDFQKLDKWYVGDMTVA